MCGICGIFVKSNRPDLAEHIKQLNTKLKHRGPDDEGYLFVNSDRAQIYSGEDTPVEVLNSSCCYCPDDELSSSSVEENFLTFGHRRLSILDVGANGHQPMCDDDQVVWIVYNGEVYNYIELRTELELLGYRFRSGTDTEVIINSYLHWGKSCVDHFNGMWAFVIYDHKKQLLFGSRDRLGVKPLYYYKENDCFLFASEQKALAKSALVKTAINERAVFDYLVLSHGQPEAEGFFKNIIELGAGCCFEFNLKTLRFIEYPFFSASHINSWSGQASEDEARIQLFSLIEKAIKIRTRSDVEIGACLSGGIDSSLIVMILDEYFRKQLKSYKPKVFTAVYPGFEFDEEKWARKVVDNTLTEWHQTLPQATDLLEDLPMMLYAADSPMLSTSSYAQFRVMKLARDNHVKVLLDGQGADELFAGYSHLNGVYYNELTKRFRFLSLLNELKSEKGIFKNIRKWLIADLRYLTQRFPPGLSKFLYEQSVFELNYIRPEFKNQFRNRFGKLHFPFEANLNETLKAYCSGEKLQAMLRLEDRMSMNFSIESRSPFSDDLDLIEYSLSLPSNLKIRHGTRKYLLREAGRDLLPPEIYARKDKIGFQTPEQQWLTELKVHIPELLDRNCDDFIFVDRLKADFIKMIDSPTSVVSSRLLRFILLAQWRKVYEL